MAQSSLRERLIQLCDHTRNYRAAERLRRRRGCGVNQCIPGWKRQNHIGLLTTSCVPIQPTSNLCRRLNRPEMPRTNRARESAGSRKTPTWRANGQQNVSRSNEHTILLKLFMCYSYHNSLGRSFALSFPRQRSLFGICSHFASRPCRRAALPLRAVGWRQVDLALAGAAGWFGGV
jgi:hypothetical protein